MEIPQKEQLMGATSANGRLKSYVGTGWCLTDLGDEFLSSIRILSALVGSNEDRGGPRRFLIPGAETSATDCSVFLCLPSAEISELVSRKFGKHILLQ
jgi:hypothetical protein